ncbi:MAG: hypothetical protein ABI411_12495 [Tahibacter sp.]
MIASRWLFGAGLLVAAASPAFASHGTTHKPAVARSSPRQAHLPPPRDPQATRWLAVDGFGEVAVYAAKGTPRGIALFASGDGGWNLGVLDMAHVAAEHGYWVAGFSTPQFLKLLGTRDGECSDVSGLFAALTHRVAEEFSLPAATKPMLIGYSSGATVVYAALAQDGGARLGGGVSLGFCPDLIIKKPFCSGAGLTASKQQVAPFGIVFDKVATVRSPWRILQGEADQVCDPKFAADFAAAQPDARAWLLPKVGHGFGVPKNWMAQYHEALRSLQKDDAAGTQ